MRTSSRKGAFDLLSQRVRNRHLLLSDFLLLPIVAVLAFALRLDSTALAKYYIPAMIAYALCAPLIKIPIFAALRLYSRFWRYASADELLLLAGAATTRHVDSTCAGVGGREKIPALVRELGWHTSC